MAGPGPVSEVLWVADIAAHDASQRTPGVLNVTKDAPQIARLLQGDAINGHCTALISRPAAGIHHGAASLVQVGPKGNVVGHELLRVAVAAVQLHVVNAPRREGSRILLHVELLTRIPAARLCPNVAVDTEFEALRMHIVGHRLHAVRKAHRVRLQAAVRLPLVGCPAVVNDDVLVTGPQPAVGEHTIGCPLDQLFTDALLGEVIAVDVASESLPCEPAHGRRPRQPIVEALNAKRPSAHEQQRR